MINIGIHKVKLVDTTGLFEFLLWCRKVVQCSARPEVVLLENIPWASTKTHKTLKFVFFFFPSFCSCTTYCTLKWWQQEKTSLRSAVWWYLKCLWKRGNLLHYLFILCKSITGMAQGHVSLVCNFALESVIHPNITGIAMKSSRQTPPPCWLLLTFCILKPSVCSIGRFTTDIVPRSLWKSSYNNIT